MGSFNQNIIRHKMGLLNLAVELDTISKARKVMRLSRDTFSGGQRWSGSSVGSQPA